MATELLTAEELAGRLRVRPDTVRIWGREGRIPRVRISGKVIRYDPAQVLECLVRGGNVPTSACSSSRASSPQEGSLRIQDDTSQSAPAMERGR